jgi:hypothetical protein
MATFIAARSGLNDFGSFEIYLSDGPFFMPAAPDRPMSIDPVGDP